MPRWWLRKAARKQGAFWLALWVSARRKRAGRAFQVQGTTVSKGHEVCSAPEEPAERAREGAWQEKAKKVGWGSNESLCAIRRTMGWQDLGSSQKLLSGVT